MTQPKVSVIMPAYNAEDTVRGSVASVLQQSLTELELVVVDDGSSDNSARLVRELADGDPRLHLICQPNRGAGPARNRGLSAARGEYIAFLDSDDYWAPDCLERLAAALDTHPGTDLAYCGWQNVGLTGGRGEPFVPPDYSDRDLVELFLGGNRWPIHGALTRREAIDRIGGFDESWSSCMDYDLWLRLMAHVRIVRVPEVLAYYRHHEGEQITKNRARGALNHWRVQHRFLERNPETVQRLGRRRVRELTDGELLRRGYSCYWTRNLQAARVIFRTVMRAGYGTPRDWKYMLPALLPLSWHQGLIRVLARGGQQ